MAAAPTTHPGYSTSLNQQELALLGELTVILGNIDDKMIQLVAHLLNVDRPCANWIMASSKISDNSTIWAEVIRSRTKDPDILWLLKMADKEIQEVSAGRNDFIHAVFQQDTTIFLATAGFDNFAPIYGRPPMMVRRVRRIKSRPFTDLQNIRDQAVYLLMLILHIDHIMAGNPAITSP
jgi:hypothetical protein